MSQIDRISVQLSYRTARGYGTSAGFKAGGKTGCDPAALLEEVGRELAMLAALDGNGAAFVEAMRETVASVAAHQNPKAGTE